LNKGADMPNRENIVAQLMMETQDLIRQAEEMELTEDERSALRNLRLALHIGLFFAEEPPSQDFQRFIFLNCLLFVSRPDYSSTFIEACADPLHKLIRKATSNCDCPECQETREDF